MAQTDIEEFVKSRPPLFWWFLANILAIALAITSWMVCLNLFRDPTHPFSYQLMLKVGRLQPLKKFTPTTAPTPRRASDPLNLEAEFQRYRSEDLEILNQELLRSYLTNYDDPKFLTYVTGEFKIQEARALTQGDFISSGAVVKAQAMVPPDALADTIPYPVFIEFIISGAGDLANRYSIGQSLTFKKVPDCAAVLHVSEIKNEQDSALYLTVIPLCSKEGHISPPEAVDLEAGLPVLP